MHDLGFLACAILFTSVVVFCIACISALPPIYTALDTSAKLIGAYWAPQLVGGVGFVIAGAMFTMETQEYWWLPAPDVLGWHIGMGNLVGGIVGRISSIASSLELLLIFLATVGFHTVSNLWAFGRRLGAVSGVLELVLG